jgi:microcystin-dependent protein
MSQAYIGDIKVVSFNFAPRNWALCNGQLLPINQYQAVFSLLGTMYGGNGTTNFALPNLQARIPLHTSGQYAQGSAGGEAAHTLTLNELPLHTHSVLGDSTAGKASLPSGEYLAGSTTVAYGPDVSLGMNPLSARPAGNSQPHNNLAPYLVLNFIICLVGIFPSRN